MLGNNEYLTAIEIGTHQIKACMGSMNKGSLSIVGYIETPTAGHVRKGEIINFNTTLELITDTLNKLENSTGKTISNVYLGVTGNHFSSTNASGTVPILTKDRVITEQDIIVATKNARDWRLPQDQALVTSYQRSFIIDETHRVSKPEGRIGNQLCAEIHMIYGDSNRLETLLRFMVTVLGEQVTDVVFSGIASFYGLDHQESAKNGILVLDIGAGVTEYVLFYDDGCMHSGQITVGCQHLINDLAIGLKVKYKTAKDILEQHGNAVVDSDSALGQINAVSNEGEKIVIPEANIHKIIELRLQELFEIIREELDLADIRSLMGDGIIITGGGAKIEDIDTLASSVFKAPCKIGLPLELEGMTDDMKDPSKTTIVGLLIVGYQLRLMESLNSQSISKVVKDEFKHLVGLVGKAIKF
ncbi:MAG: cell division protein FtsA [Lentisphaeria bacterium]|nr:cell division protein FtsA [Lentisphaeria bacterium]NQZ69375.1 cell division protein FtsA [Lentisphaeria bacterium]